MARILPIITETNRSRYVAWRFRALARKAAVISRRTRRGSIAQTEERRSHRSVAGGSTPPRAIDVLNWGVVVMATRSVVTRENGSSILPAPANCRGQGLLESRLPWEQESPSSTLGTPT